MSYSNTECFQPEEIDFLRLIFDRLCNEATFVRGTLFEELLAASLIQLYQGGDRDEATLLKLGRRRIANFTSQPAATPFPLEDVFANRSPQVSDFLPVGANEAVRKRKVDREKIERADRESKVVIDAERQAREAKTARLREQRLKVIETEPKPTSELKSR